MPGEIPIVLTATVAPNGMSAADAEKRLGEYKAALAFYLRMAPVFFLENSGYPLEQHAEFRETDRLCVRTFKPSSHPERGKGFQEFEMLDSWLSSEAHLPERWLKITGRYKILNIASILAECGEGRGSGVEGHPPESWAPPARGKVEGRMQNEEFPKSPTPELLIDQLPRSEFARTYLFGVTTAFYKKNLMGLYQQCDDRTGAWIERVLFRKLKELPQVRYFRTQGQVEAVSGFSGTAFPTGRIQWLIKQILRSANRLVDGRYLWYAK